MSYLQGYPITGFMSGHIRGWNDEHECSLFMLATGFGCMVTDLTHIASGNMLGQFAAGLGLSIPLYLLNRVVYSTISNIGAALHLSSEIQNLANRPISLIVTGMLMSPLFGSMSLGLISIAPAFIITTLTSMHAFGKDEFPIAE